MTLGSCRPAAPRIAKAGLRTRLGIIICFCLVGLGGRAGRPHAEGDPHETSAGTASPAEIAAALPSAQPLAPESNLPPAPAPQVTDAGPGAAELQPGRVTPAESHAGGVRDEVRVPADAIDFGLAPGVTTWLAGLASARRSAFLASAVLGYAFGNDDRVARVRFRLGLLFAYASLREPSGADTFLEVLVAPTLRIRAWDQRLFVSVDVGVGVLVLAGLKPSSDFLAHNQVATAEGTLSIFELRPGASLTYRLYPAVELFAGPALAWNPKKPHFHEPMLRLQLLGGVALRF